ncbi:hypothetical protein HMI56_006653 [Coelomomyces lativittatus]|nr:hypothetical protein HMI56_006653 [Coelomomyces lativittatus]
MMVVMDSLQLAHKCILNSFYGYVMRKGSRWYSMEMGGIVCYTGSKIIQLARELIEKIGIPLELDTDGIWCALPKTFPENFSFHLKQGNKSITLSYPCMMLNHLVHEKFTNHQYQMKVPGGQPSEYQRFSKNSIFFEIDGPYRAMILPASMEENRLLKKRYAVFHPNGSLAELKGFEVKRRGELKLIKIFQSQIFSVFLKGSTLEECYHHVAQVANEWLDILDGRGSTMSDSELLELITENKSMSKSLTEYGALKSTAITTAKRLAEFLGEEMVKDKLACHFIIVNQPLGAPVAERAVPVAILHSEAALKLHYLRKWLKNPSLDNTDIRSILDWDYYKERFGGVLQKLITIPASRQNISNPIPRVKQPDWVVRKNTTEKQQSKLTDLFDIEDMRQAANHSHEPLRQQPSIPSKRVSTAKPLKSSAPSRSVPHVLQSLKQVLASTSCPNPTEDYAGWLSYQRKKWKYQLLLKRQKQGTGGGSSFDSDLFPSDLSINKVGESSKSVSLGKFLQGQQSSLRSHPWHILQMKEASQGLFKVWIVVGSQLHQVQLSVPRIFYVHSNVPIPSDGETFSTHVKITDSKKVLPRQTPSLFLYECIMEETDFQFNLKSLTTFFNHPSIQGVYETQLPLIIRTLLHVGAMCQLETPLKTKTTTTFSLFDLKMVPSAHYLESMPLDDLFLFHYAKRDRQFVCIFPFKESKEEAYLFVCDPSGQNGLRDTEVMYGKLALENPLLPSSKHFSTSIHKTEIQFWASLNKHLEKVHREKSLPLLLILQSNKKELFDTVKSVQLFPYLYRPWQSSNVQLPALDWQHYLSKRWLEQLKTFPTWKQECMEMAKYANIPLCHLSEDPYMQLIDVLFSRKLVKSDHILWYSNEPRPDLGGRESDDYFLSLDIETLFPEVNQPGFYNGVSVDVELSGLCIAALMDFVNSTTSTTSTMRCFVGLVRELGIQARGGSTVSDVLLIHIYRWFMQPEVALHDPIHTSSLMHQMQKIFMELISVLKKINATVIYASLHRIVFLTPKATVNLARPYLDYVFQLLSEHATFLPMTFRPGFLWSPLLWMDTSNYGGVLKDPYDKSIQYIHTSTGFQFYLHLTEFLPPPHGNAFLEFLKEYFESQLGSSPSDKSTYLLSNYQHKLLDALPNLQRLEHGVDGLHCPTPLGTHLEPIPPTVLLVQLLCGLLSLDKDLDAVIMVLKRHTMGLLQVSSFASAAEFKQPCLPILLHQVMCHSCFFLRNVDLTREASPWTCPCGHPYNLESIESTLLRLVEMKILSVTLQDVVCKLCGTMKREHMAMYCSCGGPYEITIDSGRTKIWLEVLQQIAKTFEFNLLKGILEFALNII